MPGLGILKGGWKAGKQFVTGGWKTAGFLGTHTKGVLVGGAAAYGGWKYVSTGHLPGEEVISKVGTGIGNVADVVNQGLEATNTTLGYVNDGLQRAPGFIKDTKDALMGGDATNAIGGVGGGGQGGGLLSNLFGGIGNLLSGLFNGGTGSILGLVASAFMLFGGFGWLGKIGGVLLAALSLGLFKGNSSQQVTPSPAVAPRQDITPSVVDVPHEPEGNVIHRSR